jgi:hypothetical protein
MIVLAAMLVLGFYLPLATSLVRFLAYWTAFGLLLIVLLLLAFLDILETVRLREKERVGELRRIAEELKKARSRDDD